MNVTFISRASFRLEMKIYWLHISFISITHAIFRVATAQGKQGIWFLIFPDRENTGNFALTQGKILRQGKYFSVTQGKNYTQRKYLTVII